ncbi:MAG: UrcA family protein [Sphingomonadales bacterium]|nr:MAG: UrcA family protein [Sphingomonadales bacterium]
MPDVIPVEHGGIFAFAGRSCKDAGSANLQNYPATTLITGLRAKAYVCCIRSLMEACMKALVLLMLTFATPALAQSTVERIAMHDLDMSQRSDINRFNHRVSVAIDALCGAPSAFDPAGRRTIAACRQEAQAQVDAQMRQFAQRPIETAEIKLRK